MAQARGALLRLAARSRARRAGPARFLSARDIAAAERHAKFATTNFGQHRDAPPYLLMRRAREAQPRATLAVILVDRPFRTRIYGDAGGQRRLIELERVDLVR